MNFRKSVTQFLSLAVIIAITLGCEKVIEFDIPEAEPKLVLNGYLSPDTTFVISATQSVSYIATENPVQIPSLEGVDLDFYQNGELYSEFIEFENISGNIAYKLVDNPSSLGEFRVTASKSGYENVSAETVLSENPLNFSAIGEVVEDTDNNSEIEIRFKDVGGVANYYHILVLEENEWANEYLIEFTSRDEVIISGSDSEVFGESEENYFYDGALFTDDLFEGQTVNLKIKLVGTPNQSNTYKIQLITCSEDYYLFHKTFNAAMYGGGPFTQPVQIYTNVENGIGVFAGYNVQETDVIFE